MIVRLWRAMTYRPQRGLSYRDRRPLPPGWRPRTRVDDFGREVEPWLFLVVDAYGSEYDAGERWLPVGHDPDEAAFLILDRWLGTSCPYDPDRAEAKGIRCMVRRAGYDGGRVGVAYAAEQAIPA